MSYNYRGNQVFGRVTFGHTIIREGLRPDNTILTLDEIKAGIPVTTDGATKKGSFHIVNDPIKDGFVGVLEEMFQYSKDSYSVIKAGSNIRMNVRAIAGSGIVNTDLLTIANGKFAKAAEGDLVVAKAYSDAIAVGDDDIVNVTFEMYAYAIKGSTIVAP